MFQEAVVVAHQQVRLHLTQHRKLTRADERALVISRLEELNLFNVEHKFPSELSGGMRKRVALARATVLDPEILIYDEPTTGLDPVMIAQVDDMIAETQERHHVTSVVISHDMSSTFRIAHRIAALHDGVIVDYGTPDHMRSSHHPVVRAFIETSGTSGRRTAEAER